MATPGSTSATGTWTGPPCDRRSRTSAIPAASSPSWSKATRRICATSAAGSTACCLAKNRIPFDHRTVTTSRVAASDQNATIAAGFLGWMLDAFDFFLVVMTLTAIAKEFHKSDAAIALSITLTLAFRPVGAFIFGLLADRYGRKIPLMIDLVFYSLVEVLTGLAPNYTTFLVLRALFGIGMGAEWGVGASLVMEKVPARYRGVVSGLLQQGYALGYLLAAVCYLLVFPHWGWRPLFFIGGFPRCW